jgi:hypothetical protein
MLRSRYVWSRWSRKAVLAAAAAVSIALVAAVTAAGARQDAPKTNSPPTIEGTPRVGETLTAGNGLWLNNPTSFSYKWLRCNSNGESCSDISGATSKSYKVVSDDVGHSLVVLVTASNSDGKSTANSHASDVASGSSPPHNTQRPALSGKAQVGETLSVSKGQWSGGVDSYQYQWERCDANGSNCSSVSGATSSSYGVRSADNGKTLRVLVTAVNASGKSNVTTDRSASVEPAGGTPLPQPQPSNGCDGSKVAAAGSLQPPVRLLIDRFTFSPGLVRPSMRGFTARIHVTDSCGRAISNAQLWSTAIPYKQTSTAKGVTGSDGWATLQFNLLRGFPANPGRQQILAMLVRATKPGGSILAGVSTRRTLRLNVRVR